MVLHSLPFDVDQYSCETTASFERSEALNVQQGQCIFLPLDYAVIFWLRGFVVLYIDKLLRKFLNY